MVVHPWRIGAGIVATLLAVPVLLGSTANGDGVALRTVTTSAPALSTVIDDEPLLAVDANELFDAGSSSDAPAAGALTAAPDAAMPPSGDPATGPPTNLSSAGPSSTTASTTPPTTAPPTTAAPTTAAPTTAPPTTAPPTTAAPTTAAPAEPAPAPTTIPPTTAAPAEPAPAEPAPAEPAAPEPAPEPVPTQPTPEQWAALRQCESSGNYSIVSANGLYHGAYQFLPSTWDSVARSVGRTDLVGVLPSQAAPADQDALALALWQQRGNRPWPHCGKHLPPGP